MRRKRKRQRRKANGYGQKLAADLELERKARIQAEQKVTLYKNMSRSYWERWNWELQKRKEEVAVNRGTRSRSRSPKQHNLYEIDPSMLKDPKGEEEIARGSFGVVKLQLYRGIKVVSKELPKNYYQKLF